VEEFKQHLDELGYDSTLAVEAARSRSIERSASAPRDDARSESRIGRKRTRDEYERSLTPKPGEGFRNVKQKLRAISLSHDSTSKIRQDGRQGESDRRIYDFKPKHLFSGKVGFSRDRR